MPVQHHHQEPPRRLEAGKARVASLAFGGAPAGNLYTGVADGVARHAIEHAWREGIRHFDHHPLLFFAGVEFQWKFIRCHRRYIRFFPVENF